MGAHRSYVLTVTLNPAVDKAVSVPGFAAGKDFREEALHISAGGKGINVSQVLRHIGVKNVATGFLGGPDGGRIRRRLDREGIRQKFCAIEGNTRTSLTVLDPCRNTITRVMERGPRAGRKDLDRFRKIFLSLLGHCRCAVFSGRSIPGAPDRFYGELVAAAKRRGIITVLDTSGRPYLLALKKMPFMIKPNLQELAHVTGKNILALSGIKRAARRLHNGGIRIVAVTMGSRGAVVFDGREMVCAVPPRIKRKSPVGCGDAFIAGFIARLIRNRPLRECVRMAAACGAANALSVNPGHISPGAVKELYAEVSIR